MYGLTDVKRERGKHMIYKWNDSFCIGNEKIDAQHKKLFQIVARIENVIQDEYESESRKIRVTAEAIKYLKQYTVQHFADEEALQLSLDYEDYPAHRKLHEDFKQIVLCHNEKMERQQYTNETVQEFLVIVEKWLVEHIMNADQAIMG